MFNIAACGHLYKDAEKLVSQNGKDYVRIEFPTKDSKGISYNVQASFYGFLDYPSKGKKGDFVTLAGNAEVDLYAKKDGNNSVSFKLMNPSITYEFKNKDQQQGQQGYQQGAGAPQGYPQQGQPQGYPQQQGNSYQQTPQQAPPQTPPQAPPQQNSNYQPAYPPQGQSQGYQQPPQQAPQNNYQQPVYQQPQGQPNGYQQPPQPQGNSYQQAPQNNGGYTPPPASANDDMFGVSGFGEIDEEMFK